MYWEVDTPPKLYLVHTLSWVVNLFGIFFILAAHEHYSIDVFIAFYISTRLFLYYHTLANNRALYQRDRHRTRIWFPLFYFFESGINGIVPNQYEVPFRKLKQNISMYLTTKLSGAFMYPSYGDRGDGGDHENDHNLLVKMTEINNGSKNLTHQKTSSESSLSATFLNAFSTSCDSGMVNKVKTQ